MPQPNCLPPGAQEIRGVEERDGITHHPFLGGVTPEGVLIFMPRSKQCFLISFGKLLQAGAEAAGCTVDQLVEFARQEATSSHSGPGAPVSTGVRHARRRDDR